MRCYLHLVLAVMGLAVLHTHGSPISRTSKFFHIHGADNEISASYAVDHNGMLLLPRQVEQVIIDIGVSLFIPNHS